MFPAQVLPAVQDGKGKGEQGEQGGEGGMVGQTQEGAEQGVEGEEGVGEEEIKGQLAEEHRGYPGLS